MAIFSLRDVLWTMKQTLLLVEKKKEKMHRYEKL